MPFVDSQDAFMELFTPLHPHSRQVTPSFPPFFQILSSASLLWYVHLAPLWPSSSSSSSIFFLSSSDCLYGSTDEWDQIQCRDEDEEEGRTQGNPSSSIFMDRATDLEGLRKSIIWDYRHQCSKRKMEKADVTWYLKWDLPLYCSPPPEGDISAISTFVHYMSDQGWMNKLIRLF